jgi:hypothetical protein
MPDIVELDVNDESAPQQVTAEDEAKMSKISTWWCGPSLCVAYPGPSLIFFPRPNEMRLGLIRAEPRDLL